MTRHMTLKALLVGFAAWACFDLSATSPTFAAIAHLGGNNLPVAGLPTVTILDQAGRDISATWLPEPGQVVTIRVDGATVNSLSLLGTSAYPGICTNFAGTAGTNPDFTLSGTQLTSNDCGGKTQLVANTTIGTFTFTLPQDSDNDGLPDVWETPYGNLVATADDELSPSATAADNPQGTAARRGDGLATLDEYRGFIVSNADSAVGSDTTTLKGGTKHIRTDPSQKDFFIHVVNNQCAATQPMGSFTRYFPAGGANMFGALSTMIPGAHVHLLDFAPGGNNPPKSTLWEDFFESFSETIPAGQSFKGVAFRIPGGALTKSETDVPTDRQINKNALVSITTNPTNPTTVQKGIRLIECQVVDLGTTLGVTDWGTPNKNYGLGPSHAANAVVYTERIRLNIKTKLDGAGVRRILWAVYNPATALWIPQIPDLTASVPTLTSQGIQDFLVTKQLQYLVGHEIAHAIQLGPTSANGYHSLTSGSMMAATFLFTQDTDKATFNIPSTFLTFDQREIKMKN